MERRRLQHGVSLVEMMVGVAIGLIIVAAATLMVAGQLADNRRLLLETQIQQDLRATAELITRELRRAGYWKDVHRSTAASADLLPRLANPYATVNAGSPAGLNSGLVNSVSFVHADKDRVDNNAVDDDESLGFRLNGTVIESQLGSGNWQPLTDPGVLRVTGFTVQPRVQSVALECALDCAGSPAPGSGPCPPVQQLRSYEINITGEATHDSRVKRSVRTVVRVRNDAILGECRN